MTEGPTQADAGASGIAGPTRTVEQERETRFPTFDGFRAMAALGVLVNHVAFYANETKRNGTLGPFLSRMDIGVAVFFLISGFLLYRPFVARIFSDRASPALVPYLKRRALRIFPAYWVCLTFVVFIFGQHDLDVKGVFLHYGLLQIYSSDHIIGGPVQQAWTLSVEVTFYLFLPFWAWLTARATRGSRHPLYVQLFGCAVLYGISLVYRGALYASDVQPVGQYRSWLPGYFDYFALGIALAAVSAWVAQPGRRPWAFVSSRWFPWASWAMAVAMFVVVSTAIGLPRGPTETVNNDLPAAKEFGLQLFYGLTSFFLLLPGIFGPQDRGVIRGFLTSRVMIWLGLVSYGIYLWHESALEAYADWTDTLPFVGDFAEMLAVTVALTLAAAAISYYVVERPALRLKDRGLRHR